MYKIGSMPRSIPIGYTGETNFRSIEIDMTAWMDKMPDGVPSIVHIRPGEEKEDAYVAVTEFDRETGILSWTITAADIGTLEGEGEMQVWLEETENDTVNKRGKSVIVKTKVIEAANDPDENVPTSQEAFLEQVTSLKTQTVTAKEAAEDAQAAAEDAQEAAEQAAEDAENVNLHPAYIDETTKNWMVYDADNNEYVDTQIKAQGEDATTTLVCPAYADLTFPVSKETLCYKDGTLYKAKQDIATSEAWTAAHWDATNLATEQRLLKTAIQGMNTATASDVGKALSPKTVAEGKVTEWQFITGGGGSVDPQDIEDAVDEWLTENISNPDSPPLDRSLSTNVSAAPADLVGNIVNSVHHYTFESGTFNSTTGATTTNNGRARTTGFVSDIVDIVDASLIADGALVYAWDSTDTYVGFWGGSGWVTSGSKYLSKIDFTQLRKNYPGYKYKLVVKSNNSSTAQQSVIDDIISKMVFIDTDSLAYRVDELEKNALQINPLNQNIGVEYASGGYSLSYDGTITITESNARLHTVENIPSDVKSITCLSGFVFLLYAMNSNGKSAGSYKENGTFSTNGVSALLTHIDLTKYNYYGFRIVLRSDNGTDAVTIKDAQENLIFTPFATHDSDVTSEDEPDIYVDRDNNLCLCAIKTDILDNKIPYHRGFLFHSFASGTGNKMYYGNSFNKVKEIGTFPIDPRDWRFAISPKDGTIIAAKREQRNWLYVFNEDVIRTLSFSTNAMAWLYNSGVEFIKDGNDNEYCIFAEYDGNAPYDEFNVWRGTYPYTSNSDWSVVKTMTPQEIGHFHMVKRDPWSNVLYLTSGDDSAQCFWWYSTDFGETWTLLTSGTASGWEDHICRTINFIFTEDAVYWATDKGTNHCLNKATRDANGIIDPSTRVKLCDLPSGQATNSLCYVEIPRGLFMYERIDIGYTTQYGDPVSFKFYDLTDNTLKDLMDIPMAEESWGGCRGKCYINYTNSVQPLPAMGFSTDTPCIFNIVADDLDKIGTIVFDPASKRFYTVNKE